MAVMVADHGPCQFYSRAAACSDSDLMSFPKMGFKEFLIHEALQILDEAACLSYYGLQHIPTKQPKHIFAISGVCR